MEGEFVDWSRDTSRAVYKQLESSTVPTNETQGRQANHDAENLGQCKLAQLAFGVLQNLIRK